MSFRVTITGADDSTDIEDMIAVHREFPEVEWGILMSYDKEGTRPRYPSREWVHGLIEVAHDEGLHLSAHLCSRWARDLFLRGKHSWNRERPEYFGAFPRVQLNVGGRGDIARPMFWQHVFLPNYSLLTGPGGRQTIVSGACEWIVQSDGTNHALFRYAIDRGLNVSCLHDRSGGRGVTPDSWPTPIEGVSNGYAGGLGPDNIERELRRIFLAYSQGPRRKQYSFSDRIWFDMESGVRSDEGSTLDMDKVKQCLEIVRKFSWCDATETGVGR